MSQLSGGIHRYLERYGSRGFFKGANFVFDARGLQKPRGADVHGRCFSCGAATEAMSSDRVCAVCRDQVLQCDSCRTRLRGVYFCRDHSHFGGKFFPFLEHFSVPQLRVQQTALKAMAAPGGCLHTERRRRRALNKQLKRIQNRIDVLTSRAVFGGGGSGGVGASSDASGSGGVGASSDAGGSSGVGASSDAGGSGGVGGGDVGGDGDVDSCGTVSGGGVMSTGDGRCRSCGRMCLAVLNLLHLVPDTSTSYCHGDCWGFFQATRRSKGYISLDNTALTDKN